MEFEKKEIDPRGVPKWVPESANDQWDMAIQIQDQWFRMEMAKIHCVLETSKIFPVPGSRDHAAGVVVYQKRLIPVFFMKKDPKQNQKESKTIVVLESSQGEVGIGVDQVRRNFGKETESLPLSFPIDRFLATGEAHE